jgi:hypothetical protein
MGRAQADIARIQEADLAVIAFIEPGGFQDALGQANANRIAPSRESLHQEPFTCIAIEYSKLGRSGLANNSQAASAAEGSRCLGAHCCGRFDPHGPDGAK